MANFGPKPWSNPFENISIISFFLHLVFRAYKGVFLLQNIIKHIFLTQTAFKNKREKWPGLDQNHGLTPLEKSQSFDFINFLFLLPRKAFFLLQNITKHIFLTQIVLKKREKWPILDQNHGLTPLDKSQCFDFFNFVFLSPRKVFFCSRIS